MKSEFCKNYQNGSEVKCGDKRYLITKMEEIPEGRLKVSNGCAIDRAAEFSNIVDVSVGFEHTWHLWCRRCDATFQCELKRVA